MFEGAESPDISCGCGVLLVGRLKVSLAFEVNMIAVISFHSNLRTSEALVSYRTCQSSHNICYITKI